MHEFSGLKSRRGKARRMLANLLSMEKLLECGTRLCCVFGSLSSLFTGHSRCCSKCVSDPVSWRISDMNLPRCADGSADPRLNAALASVLQKAKAAGVPKDNIEKALMKV